MKIPFITGVGVAGLVLIASPTFLTIPVAMALGAVQFGFTYAVTRTSRK